MPRKPLAQSRELPIILGAVGTIPRRSPVCAGKRRKVQTFLKKPKSLNFWCAEVAPHKTGIWAASKLIFKRSAALTNGRYLTTCANPYRRVILWWSAKWIGFAGQQRKACSMWICCGIKVLPSTFSIWACWTTPLWGGLWQRCCLLLLNLKERR